MAFRAVFACLLTIAFPLGAQEARQQRVLALYATTPGAAGALTFEATYQKTFGDALGPRLDSESEYIDLARFSEPTLWDRYNAYISGALVLFVLQTALITGLLLQSARRRRAEREMREKQKMLEASNRQISELFGRLIATQETERSRIARDLHDDVSQRIAALSLSMGSLKRKLSNKAGNSDEVAELSAMQRDAVALAEGVRNVSHDLHPSTLQHAGLVTALGEFCGQFGRLHSLAITFNAAPDLGQIDGTAALCLYRVVQEALHNVAKHAQARDVTVSLTRSGDVVHLSIVDDGKGFHLAGERGHGGGLGLISIDERVRVMGGQMAVDTRPGGGTRLSVSIQQ